MVKWTESVTEGAARAVGAIGAFLQAPRRLERLEGLRGSARRGSLAQLPTVWGKLQQEVRSLLSPTEHGDLSTLINQMSELVAEATAQKEFHITRVEQGNLKDESRSSPLAERYERY